MTRLWLILVPLTVTAVLASSTASARLPRRSDRAEARRLLVRYFDAIRDDDHATACRIYRIHGCASRKPFGLDSYELGTIEHLIPPAEGDWGSLIYLYAPKRSNGTRAVAVALAVVTCRPTCHVTGFWDTAA